MLHTFLYTETGWIGVYGEEDNITATVPMRFAFVCRSNCDSQPQQKLAFRLPNMRTGLRFVFFDCSYNQRGWPDPKPWPADCTAVAQSEVVAVVDPNTPTKPRIIPTTTPGSLRLMWSSKDIRSGVFASWGTVKGQHPNRALDVQSGTYGAEDMCAAPATTVGFRSPGAIHSAVLGVQGVPAGARVYYVFGDGDAISEEHSLIVPPLPGQAGKDGTRLAIYADMGRGTYDDSFTWHEYGRPALNTTRQLLADVDNGIVHAIAHFGDISYATGYASVWDDWLQQIAPVASQVAYSLNTGNHESDTAPSAFLPGMRQTYYQGRDEVGGDSGGECSVPTFRLWRSPRVSEHDPWWSWNVGNVHIVAISTEYNFTTGSDQWRWLQTDLSTVDRSVTPWVILGAHRPMYISSNYTEGITADQVVAQLLRDHVEPLTSKWGVDLAFYGHNHAVQRYCASLGGKCMQRSQRVQWANGVRNVYDHPPTTVHMLVGSAGAGFTVNEVIPPPDYVEWQDYFFGYVRVSSTNNTQIRVQFVHNTDGAILDDFVINKNAPSSNAEHKPSSDGMPVGELASLVALGVVLAACVLGALYMHVSGRCAKQQHNDSYAPMQDGSQHNAVHANAPQRGAEMP